MTTGLITTEGFRDSLEIARGNRPDFFNLFYVKPAPFVPRHLRREVPGRLAPTAPSARRSTSAGCRRSSPTSAPRASRRSRSACCTPTPTRRTRSPCVERLRELWPDVSVVASHQITREWREYERTSTTVLSAYVQPVAERYLTALHAGLAGEGFGGPPYIMQSNCGVDSVEHASGSRSRWSSPARRAGSGARPSSAG